MKEDGLAQTYYDAVNKAVGSERFHNVVRSVYDYVQNMGIAAEKIAHQVYPMLSYLQDVNHATTIATLATMAAMLTKGTNTMRDEFIAECLDEEEQVQRKKQLTRSKLFPYAMKEHEMRKYDVARDNNVFYNEGPVDPRSLHNFERMPRLKPYKRPTSRH